MCSETSSTRCRIFSNPRIMLLYISISKAAVLPYYSNCYFLNWRRWYVAKHSLNCGKTTVLFRFDERAVPSPMWPFALASVRTAQTRATRWHDSTLAVVTVEQPNLMQIVLPVVDGTFGALTVALGQVLVNARPAKHMVAPSENHVLVVFLQEKGRPRV